MNNKNKNKIKGTFIRPRICVFKSLKHIYVQAVNDDSGKTIASSSSLDKRFFGKNFSKFYVSKLVGTLLAKKLIESKIKFVVFDRKFYSYEGIVKLIANAIRKSGILF